MYEIEIIAGFSSAHLLREYKGKCEHLHGHNYKVHVTVQAESPGPGGMIIDFGELKQITGRVLEPLDHAFLNEIPPFDKIEPSAENLAAYLFDQIASQLPEQNGTLSSVAVWESDTARATFRSKGE
jgi:6-pyruvoyltetrahydropterin/6-carboxytetrahydropterin synthase